MRTDLLIIDDDAAFICMVQDVLATHDIECHSAHDIATGRGILSEHSIDAILLDKSLNKEDSVHFIREMHSDPLYRGPVVPIIMLSAKSSGADIQEGIDAGAYYYLCKPFDNRVLVSVIRAAIRDHNKHHATFKNLNEIKHSLCHLTEMTLEFQTIEQAIDIAHFVAGLCYEPDKVLYGIHELVVNAIEHGNLELSYDDKKQSLIENCLVEEINQRYTQAPYKDRKACLTFSKKDFIEIQIKDQGRGFDWQKYMDIDANRLTDPNGRGIATTRMMSLPDLTYTENGTRVICKLYPEPATPPTLAPLTVAK